MHGDVLSVSQDSPTYDVHGMLVEGSVDLVPVADDDGTLRGVVTKTDLLRSANLAEWSTERRVSWRDLLPWRRERQRLVEAAFVADVMMPTPSVIEETSSIAVALERFARDRGRVLPVVSASGALVGMLEAAQVFVACLGADQTLPSGANPLPVR